MKDIARVLIKDVMKLYDIKLRSVRARQAKTLFFHTLINFGIWGYFGSLICQIVYPIHLSYIDCSLTCTEITVSVNKKSSVVHIRGDSQLGIQRQWLYPDRNVQSRKLHQVPTLVLSTSLSLWHEGSKVTFVGPSIPLRSEQATDQLQLCPVLLLVSLLSSAT